MRLLRLSLLSLFAIVVAASAAMADDWTAARLRGSVLQFVNGAWEPVHRHDVVPDETPIRTLANGYVDFTRGTETVSLGPTTQVQIFDKGGVKPFTTVNQAFGTVTVDAEVRNVQHFAVETPFLAAVVKGTKFIVTSGKDGSSVKVLRGHVEVDDKLDKTHTVISVGQSATVGSGAASTGGTASGGNTTGNALIVSGSGVLPDILDSAGNVVHAVGGVAKGVVNGVVNGVSNGITGLVEDSDSGTGSDTGTAGGLGGVVGGVVGGVGNLVGGLGLRLGYPLEADGFVPEPGLWI